MCRRMVERWKGHLVLFTGINIDLINSNPDSACTCIFLGPAYRFENSCKLTTPPYKCGSIGYTLCATYTAVIEARGF